MPISINNFTFATFLSVDFGDSSGSGFRIRCNEEDYIITAKHVIYRKDILMSDLWVKSRNYDGDEIESFSARILLNEKNVVTFGNKDIVAIKLDPSEIESIGVNISITELADLGGFDSIIIGTNIFLVGFPSSLIIDDFYDVDRPLLRTGIIAGKNINDVTFVIDSMAYYGVSGGPVVQIDNERNIKIVGIVSRYVPFITEWKNRHEISMTRQDFSNSGYAVCLPLDDLITTISQIKQYDNN